MQSALSGLLSLALDSLSWRGEVTGVEVVKAIEDVLVELADSRGVAGGPLALLPEALHSSHEHHLDGGHGHQGKGVADHGPGHGKVVQGAPIQHLCPSLEPGPALDVCSIGLAAHLPSDIQPALGLRKCRRGFLSLCLLVNTHPSCIIMQRFTSCKGAKKSL